ncbi:chemotaxis protein CheA [Aerolutibacter ruishenii]|uniref:Chemotaxis protein CheA n=1 Tax=Aerolutibacter ruishenii TaxID=686800 RepID=A0A562LK37_9GAMM|nr:chemotaxis protein CheA [Lysobacter ruishenii]TWI08000.1 two-component system chemotaxis sensor kinase CheA [Lysobacter ruishenii]
MDMSRFHAAFFEESREGLDAMERGLLAMESGDAEADTLHVVFRAAHSIKGGAATFGFSTIAELTHLLETLLDEARNGRRQLDSIATGALLVSVDVLRGLLEAAEHGGGTDDEAVAHARRALERVLASPADGAAAPASAAKPSANAEPEAWHIVFKPFPSLFLSGNDPLRMLRELDQLGAMTSRCLDASLPAFAALDPHQAFLGWDITLPGTVKRAAIDEVFAWVEDECELDIQAVMPAAAAPAPAPALPSPATTDAAPTTDGIDRAGRRATDAPQESSIRIAVAKIDALINLVGELVITQAMLQQRAAALDPNEHEPLLAGLVQLERNTRNLQESVLGVRMLPVEFAFSRFPRMVRDIASRLGKRVQLRTQGEATELDKGVIEKIVDPLVHLVRNAIDHGLEMPEERRAAGKDETGTLALTAAHQGGHILIEIVDDGRGLDRDKILKKALERGLPVPENATDTQIHELIFHPGFSTADAVSDLSGRGVGMDVVKSNITSLGGTVEIRSEHGRGTTIAIRLPLTLAILDGMSVSAGGEVFILPLNVVVESLQPAAADIRTMGGQSRVMRLRDDYLPLLNLAEQYQLPRLPTIVGDADPIAVVVEANGQRVALEVDELVGQQQVVVKNLETHYHRIQGVAGATILGDGRVALIVDPVGLAQAAALPSAA